MCNYPYVVAVRRRRWPSLRRRYALARRFSNDSRNKPRPGPGVARARFNVISSVARAFDWRRTEYGRLRHDSPVHCCHLPIVCIVIRLVRAAWPKTAHIGRPSLWQPAWGAAARSC